MSEGFFEIQGTTLFGCVWIPVSDNIEDRGSIAVHVGGITESVMGTVMVKDDDNDRWLVHIRPGFVYGGS